MKKIILLVTLLFSSSIFAASMEWSELEQYSEYKLTQKISFENGVTLASGEVYEVREIEALSIPGYPMFYYSFHKKNCTQPNQTAEMVIVEIPGKDRGVSIGVELEEGCNLSLYLEVKDYYLQSAFE